MIKPVQLSLFDSSELTVEVQPKTRKKFTNKLTGTNGGKLS